ncbi:MAG: cytochrome c biogenesis protein CcsA [Candidatus Hodarchaeales archaeon]|jgi:ABC-type transport system involved in cytochrome c biogenesis permease subunit
MLFQERIQKNQNLIGLAIISLFIVVNYYLILITVESFEGFNVSGHPIFYMVPFAFSTYLCFGIVLLMSVLFLWKKQNVFDLILVAGAQVGTLVGAITIIVGMIWSYVEWGYFWQWEPRQTATLIMWLAYVGLLIFRGMLDEKNPEKRGTLSAIFGIATFPSVPLSNYVVGALHPPPQQTSLAEGVGLYLMLNFLFIGLVTLFLVYLTFRVNEIDFHLRKIRRIKMEDL